MFDGIINVYKERGYTSHDVVARLRGILKQKKIGHTGTLDPDAVGVLPVCLGCGTKLCDMMTDTDKEYEAVMLLGMTTDTQDTSGRILSERPVSGVTGADLEAVLPAMTGEILQVPPMYSAVKVQGKKLYELARSGRTVERPARPVTVYDIRLLTTLSPVNMRDYRVPEDTKAPGIPLKDVPEIPEKASVTLRIRCSKGTYVRTLIEDLGEMLGCGACMAALVRVRSGRFELRDARTLDEVAAAAKAAGSPEVDPAAPDPCAGADAAAKHLADLILPVDACLADLAAVTVTSQTQRLLENGNPLPEDEVHWFRQETPDGIGKTNVVEDAASRGPFEDGRAYRVYDPQGGFRATYRYDAENHIFRADKMFR